MKTLEPEDLLKFGLIPEFIGRLPMISTLEDLKLLWEYCKRGKGQKGDDKRG